MSSERANGCCVCGSVRWAVKPPYRFFQYCHCSRCRKRTGSVHACNLAVMDGQLEWLEGEAMVQRYELPEAKSWCNAFCTRCGSAAPWKTRNGRAWVVPAGSLDTPEGAPQRNVWFGSRASWYLPAAELPHFDEDPK